MRKLILITIFALLFTGCGLGTFSVLTKVTDNKGNRYSVAVTKNEAEHSVKASVSYKGKNYTCDVIHYTEGDFNTLGLEFDFSSIDATGEVYVTYKGNKYGCSVVRRNKIIKDV